MLLRARALGMSEGLWAITMLPDVGVGMVTVMPIRLGGFVGITEERWVVQECVDVGESLVQSGMLVKQ